MSGVGVEIPAFLRRDLISDYQNKELLNLVVTRSSLCIFLYMQVFKISYFNRKTHEGFPFLINSVAALIISASHIACVVKQRGYIKGKLFFFFFMELGQCLILGNKLIKEIPLILFYISVVYRIEFINQLKGGKEANDFWSVSHYFFIQMAQVVSYFKLKYKRSWVEGSFHIAISFVS